MSAEEWAKILDVIGFPVAVFMIFLAFFYIFQKDISRLFTRLQRARSGDNEASFSDALNPQEKPDDLKSNNEKTQAILAKSETTQISTNLEEKVEISEKNQGELQSKSKIEETNWVLLAFDKQYDESRKILFRLAEEINDKTKKVYYHSQVAWVRAFYDFPGAVEELKNLIKDHPTEDSPYHELSLIYSANNLRKDAIAVLDEGITRVTEPSPLQLTKAQLLEEYGQYDQAINTTNEIIQAKRQLDNVAKAYLRMGSINNKQAKPAEARKAYLEAYFIMPTDSYILREVADFMRDKAKDYKTELFFRNRLLGLDRNTSVNWIYLGNCFLMLELNGLAMNAYEKGRALSNEPQRWIESNIGNLYNVLGLFNQAIEFLQKAAEIDPQDDYSHERLAQAMQSRKNQIEKSDEIIKTVADALGGANATNTNDTDKGIAVPKLE